MRKSNVIATTFILIVIIAAVILIVKIAPVVLFLFKFIINMAGGK